MKDLVYNVVYERNGVIEKHNIFEHGSFVEDLKEIKEKYGKALADAMEQINAAQGGRVDGVVIAAFKEDYKKNIFAKDLKEILRYYFWSRAEYEIILTDWPTSITQEEAKRVLAEFEKRDHYRECVNLPVAVKVDVYDQITLNFGLFVDYVWENLSNL